MSSMDRKIELHFTKTYKKAMDCKKKSNVIKITNVLKISDPINSNK